MSLRCSEEASEAEARPVAGLLDRLLALPLPLLGWQGSALSASCAAPARVKSGAHGLEDCIIRAYKFYITAQLTLRAVGGAWVVGRAQIARERLCRGRRV